MEIKITCQRCLNSFNSIAEPDDSEGATYECPFCGSTVDMSGFVYQNYQTDDS